MLSTLLASATAFPEVELTFPNLFGGITLSYYQGFELFGIKIYCCLLYTSPSPRD